MDVDETLTLSDMLVLSKRQYVVHMRDTEDMAESLASQDFEDLRERQGAGNDENDTKFVEIPDVKRKRRSQGQRTEQGWVTTRGECPAPRRPSDPSPAPLTTARLRDHERSADRSRSQRSSRQLSVGTLPSKIEQARLSSSHRRRGDDVVRIPRGGEEVVDHGSPSSSLAADRTSSI